MTDFSQKHIVCHTLKTVKKISAQHKHQTAPTPPHPHKERKYVLTFPLSLSLSLHLSIPLVLSLSLSPFLSHSTSLSPTISLSPSLPPTYILKSLPYSHRHRGMTAHTNRPITDWDVWQVVNTDRLESHWQSTDLGHGQYALCPELNGLFPGPMLHPNVCVFLCVCVCVREKLNGFLLGPYYTPICVCVCVCVCVWVCVSVKLNCFFLGPCYPSKFHNPSVRQTNKWHRTHNLLGSGNKHKHTHKHTHKQKEERLLSIMMSCVGSKYHVFLRKGRQTEERDYLWVWPRGRKRKEAAFKQL